MRSLATLYLQRLRNQSTTLAERNAKTRKKERKGHKQKVKKRVEGSRRDNEEQVDMEPKNGAGFSEKQPGGLTGVEQKTLGWWPRDQRVQRPGRQVKPLGRMAWRL